ncbi:MULTISPECIES: hypothetical protein [Bacillus]|uniref:hypothetical protein n=1 Tax=Bacillus TaxID=1386 RepID=UPI000A728060|nr:MULTISPECIES: hypothetical protein [Bacillus]MDU0072724.1 hypothetical protein [Bacillus sp. IG6]MED8020499.1 hypothetical protein [Bacillus glycinifermentans]WKB77896.1 hypothetical protein QYM22_03125 [Bacillus glycinifermentans]
MKNKMVEPRKAFKAVAFLINEQTISKAFYHHHVGVTDQWKAFFLEIRDKPSHLVL